METSRSWARIPYGEPSPPARTAAPAMSESTPPTSGDDCLAMVLAMAYVKRQRWGELYEPEAGLSRGTVFADLDLPFMGEGACGHNE